MDSVTTGTNPVPDGRMSRLRDSLRTLFNIVSKWVSPERRDHARALQRHEPDGLDGPFPETKELIAGFWIIQAKSIDEAVEWVKRAPNPMLEDSDIEIRQVFDLEDFGDAATPEIREHEAQMRAQVEARG
jgi:hypothetical protein